MEGCTNKALPKLAASDAAGVVALEIEITPQMIFAGALRYESLCEIAEPDFLVLEVYKAMAQIAPVPSRVSLKKNSLAKDSHR